MRYFSLLIVLCVGCFDGNYGTPPPADYICTPEEALRVERETHVCGDSFGNKIRTAACYAAAIHRICTKRA